MGERSGGLGDGVCNLGGSSDIICLIKRGIVTFHDKAVNCEAGSLKYDEESFSDPIEIENQTWLRKTNPNQMKECDGTLYDAL